MEKIFYNFKKVPHCECCGRENPYTHHTDSYTECCNERVCYGPQALYFHQEDLEVFRTSADGKTKIKSCCGAMADAKWNELNLED